MIGPEEPSNPGPRRGFGAVVTRLTTVNLTMVALAFLTSPILARTLGPRGRGQVAAVFAVLSLAPWISEFGVTAFLGRERARRDLPLGTLLGSMLPVAMFGSLIGVGLAVPLAHVIGRGRADVVLMIEIGLVLLPLNVFTGTLYGIALGDSQWTRLIAVRLISSVGSAASIVVLAVTSHLTIITVCVTYIAAGIASNLPLLRSLHGSRPWRFSATVARTGLAFGLRSWVSTLANTSNAQIDQLLMAGLVSSRQLGLYALAVTIATATNSLVAAAGSALLPRVANGDALLAARSCRVSLLLAVVFAICVGASSPVFVPFVFGSPFKPMIPMLLILLVASLFYIPGQVLGQSLIAFGHPSPTARAQLAGLILTVPGLLILLPSSGGIGAAIVSVASYATSFVMILRASRRVYGISATTLLRVSQDDLRWLRSRLERRRRTGAAESVGP